MIGWDSASRFSSWKENSIRPLVLRPKMTACQIIFKKEALAPHNVTFQVSDEELDEVFNW